jgi:hypothetical protein
MKKLLLLLVLTLGINQTTQPISVSNARIVAGAIAVSAASGAFYLTASDEASKRKYDLDEQGNPKKISLGQKCKMPVLAAAVAGATVGGLSYWLLYGYTPEWNFSELNTVRAEIVNNIIAKQDFEKSSVNDFISIQWGQFISYYLVKARLAARGLIDQCDYALGLTEKLKGDLPDGVDIGEVTKGIPAINDAKMNAYAVAIVASNNPQYRTQVHAYLTQRFKRSQELASSVSTVPFNPYN